jgi:hypothetical protein
MLAGRAKRLGACHAINYINEQHRYEQSGDSPLHVSFIMASKEIYAEPFGIFFHFKEIFDLFDPVSLVAYFHLSSSICRNAEHHMRPAYVNDMEGVCTGKL